MPIIVVFLLAYLLGSLPFGYLLARIWNIDIRERGSGNIGATNVLRTLGPLPAALVFGLDLLKGTAAVYLATSVTTNQWLIVLIGATAILGHMFSVFLGFKGGRGVATGLGLLLGIAPDIFVGALVLACLIIGLTRYVSVGSIFTPLVVVAALIILKRPLPYTIIVSLFTGLIIIKHIPNIKRLLDGSEPKIGERL
jgi:glycerol-3-phosphate acyltransferase PlsY